MRTQLLDPIPVLGVFLLFAIITLGFYEIGFRVGRWWQDRLPGEQEGPTDMLVGSLLALMAFLLAITMGMAADRFDARRGARAGGGERHPGRLPPGRLSAAGRRPTRCGSSIREYLPRCGSPQATRRGCCETSHGSRSRCTLTCGRSSKRSSRPGTTRMSCRRSATRSPTSSRSTSDGSSAGMYSRVPQTVLHAAARRLRPLAGHGRLQRRPGGPAERPERRRDGRRAGRRARSS